MWPWAVLVALVVVVGVVAVSLSGFGGSSSKPTVNITGFGFEWNTGSFCNNFAMSTPAVPFSVAAGSPINFSWYLICQLSNGGPSSGAYTITSVSSLTSGFPVAGSNVPVTVYFTTYTWFNVTVGTPSSGYSGEVFVFINAS